MPRKENKMLPKYIPPLALPAPQSNKPSFLSVLKDGFAFGLGNSLAHRLLSSSPAQPTNKTNPEYELCVKEKNENCENYLK